MSGIRFLADVCKSFAPGIHPRASLELDSEHLKRLIQGYVTVNGESRRNSMQLCHSLQRYRDYATTEIPYKST